MGPFGLAAGLMEISIAIRMPLFDISRAHPHLLFTKQRVAFTVPRSKK
jgi:hypothetical protein